MDKEATGEVERGENKEHSQRQDGRQDHSTGQSYEDAQDPELLTGPHQAASDGRARCLAGLLSHLSQRLPQHEAELLLQHAMNKHLRQSPTACNE